MNIPKDYDTVFQQIYRLSRLPPRDDIPEDVKRLVRQQAGFGCCKCGRPVFQYHHLVERSENPQDIMPLCPNCHDEATKGAMNKTEQIAYKTNPYNIIKGYVQGSLKIDSEAPVIDVGTIQLVHNGDLIIVDGQSLLSLYLVDGRLELSVKLYDPTGHLLAEIEYNEWKSGDPLAWDIESSYQWLTIRHKKRAIALDIDVRSSPLRMRVDLWHNKQLFSLDPSQIRFDGVVQNIHFVSLCLVGMRFVVNSNVKQLILEPDPRYGAGNIISNANIPERVRAGIEAWKKLEDKALANQQATRSD